MAALIQREVQLAVKLAADSKTNQPTQFAGTKSDQVTVKGARTSVRIQNSGSLAGSKAHIDVYGLAPSLMNELSTLGMVFNQVPKNTVTILAGNAGSALTPVFSGTIWACYGDYEAAPDVSLHFECNPILADAVAPMAATTFTGAVDVAEAMAGFARQLSVGFENNDVKVKLPASYYPGSIRTQLQKMARDANIEAQLVDGGAKLAIWPKGGNRATQTPPLIAPPPDGQMIGYPAFTQQGIIVRTVFDPLISFGGLIKVRSRVLQGALTAQKQQNPAFQLPTDSTWAVNKLDLALDAKVPRGQWMSTVHAYNPKYPRPIPQRT